MRLVRRFDPWKGPLCTCPPKYSLHPYTGCSHRCLYCYATSYIRKFKSTPKKDFIQTLEREIKRIDPRLPINLSTSSDPYPPEEKAYQITRQAIEILTDHGFKILITTKGTLFTRDLDILSRSKAAIMVTITSLDSDLGRILEPGAPLYSERIRAIKKAINHNIPVGVRIDPIIPYINDDIEIVKELMQILANIGVKHIVTSTYKARPDSFSRLVLAFPELEPKLRLKYFEEGMIIGGYRYLSLSDRKKLLDPILKEAKKLGLTYATCREGFGLGALSCDGSHLIKNPHTPKLNNARRTEYTI